MGSTLRDYQIRAYRTEDEDGVLDLLRSTLGSGASVRNSEFFKWKHFANPFGPSFMLVAERRDEIIGLRAFMRWRFRSFDRVVTAVSAVDTATHPDHQGRGIFSRLTRQALEHLASEADVIFNTPNEKSLPGYLKLGWQIVGRMPVQVRPRRPLRMLRLVGKETAASSGLTERPPVSALPAAAVLEDVEGIADLLAKRAPADNRFSTERSPGLLAWRYGRAPGLDYRAVSCYRDGGLRGLALFRVRPRRGLWETMISDLIVGPGDKATARLLVRRVIESAPVDHLSCHFPARTDASRASLSNGFVRAPGGIMLVVNPLRSGLPLDPVDPRSWGLTLGDLEVF